MNTSPPAPESDPVEREAHPEPVPASPGWGWGWGRWRAWIGSPYLLCTLSVLASSGNWLVARATHLELSGIELAFWRSAGALPLLWLYNGAGVWAVRRVLLRSYKLVVVVSLLGGAVYHSLLYVALHYTTAINAALLNSAMPISIVLISWVAYRDRVTSGQLLGILLSMVGVLVILARGNPVLLASMGMNVGDLVVLLDVFIFALYTVLIKRIPGEVGPMVLLTLISTIGTIALGPLYAIQLWAGQGMALTVTTLASVLYVSMISLVVAMSLWLVGVKKAGPNKAGVFLHLQPAFTTILAIAFLGERVRPYHGAGIAMIALGIYLTTRSGRRPRAR
jgi:drug/metabolite transporter (DMT)-like permease